MRKILLLLLPLSLGCLSSSAQSVQMNLDYSWKDTTLPGSMFYNNTYNEIWGYAANGEEYAIIGSTAGTHFFRVTPGMAPQQVDFVAGKQQGPVVVHRDYKHYDHYLYAVCDEGNSSLQIIDLQYLPDSVHLVYDADSLVNRSHNVFVDTTQGFLYVCSARTFNPGAFVPMRILSLANPEVPTLVADWGVGLVSHVHDAYVDDHLAWLNCGPDGLFVVDFQLQTNPSTLATVAVYPDKGYNHSGWITENGQQYVMCDENWGYTMKLFDVSDLQNISVQDTFLTWNSNFSIAHNALIRQGRIYVSHYHEGVRVYDFSSQGQVVESAHFDTSPLNAANGTYQGCWGVYPFLPSGRILASDMQEGLFVLTPPWVLSQDDAFHSSPSVIYPNPSDGSSLGWNWPGHDVAQVSVHGLNGVEIHREQVKQGQTRLSFKARLPMGSYVVILTDGSNNQERRVLMVHP